MVVEKKLSAEKGDHKVTFTLTMALAFPTDDSDPKPMTRGMNGLMKGKRKLFEAPKPHYYYHLEYKLFPNDPDPVKADVVTYGVAAKIYSESDSKVLKTWRDGDKTWVTWTHSHTATITKETLLQLFSHSMELKIWDTKDKVSPRARFDRPKAFRIPASRGAEDSEGGSGGVQQIVMSQQQSFENTQPKQSRTTPFPDDDGPKRHSKTAQTFHPGSLDMGSIADPSRAITAPSTFRSLSLTTSPSTATGFGSMVKVQVRVDEQDTPQFSRLATLAGVTPPMTDGDLHFAEQRQIRSQSRKERSHSKSDGTKKKSSLVKGGPSKKDIAIAEAHKRIHGTATLCVKMYTFFSGVKSNTTKLGKPAGNIEELLLSVSLDNELLSEIQKRELNPMVIRVSSASELPNKPLTYMQLKEKCQPVHVSYQFYKQPLHESTGRDHGSDVYWEDVNVVLLGTLDKGGLAEYLQGPHFQIEVHDRDRKIEQKKPKPSLFGENPEDEMINNVSLVAGRRTTHNPFTSRDKPWDPYGIAKFDLSGLLLGQKYLYLRSPIHCCPLPDTHSGLQKPDGAIVGQPGNVDGPEDKPMPVANYLECGSELKIKVDLAFPLNASEEDIKATETTPIDECPFGRVIYVFEYKNAPFLRQLQSEITAVNAEALELDTLPQHVIEAALSTYKLSKDQRKNKKLDIITGFQVLDGQYHVFVLEGLGAKGIKRLWEKLPRPQEEDITKFNVLYNSDLRFNERLYASLDVDLCRVRLHEPLEVIVQNPLLYVRDLVPKPCFDALAKLDQMLKVTKLREVTRNDLFPSADMVISMSREFGVPLTAEDFGELESSSGSEKEEAGTGNLLEEPRPRTTRPWTPLSLFNSDYVAMLKEREQTLIQHDFIKENILRTRTTEPKRRPQTIAVDITELHQQTAHNYSIQTLNSTELAKEKLRQVLAKDEDRRFTYCPQYNSATVLPIHPETVKKQDLMDSKELWRTDKGFIFPGKKTSLVSNVHPKKPDSARVDELEKPWKENILHANILKPTVNRENFPWDYRDADLNLLSVPPPFFDKNPVLSVHAAGDTKEQEETEAAERHTRQWQERIVVDDTIFRTHRCLTETELRHRGRKASNQLAKLEGLLKNNPKKFSLSRAGLTVEEIPPLGVVVNPNVDTPARKTGKLVPIARDHKEQGQWGFYPGPYEKEGWLLEKNKVPIPDQEHEKFRSLKGHDFRLYYNDKDVLCRRPIEPLQDEERDNHLFRVADICS
ncbi:hypothetical protein ACROYT_G034311 [Oculina patagonica]